MRVKIDIPNNVYQLPKLSSELLADPDLANPASWLFWNTMQAPSNSGSKLSLGNAATLSTQASLNANVSDIYVISVLVNTLPEGRSLNIFTSDAEGMHLKISPQITSQGLSTFAIDPGISGTLRIGLMSNDAPGNILIGAMSCKIVTPFPEFINHSLHDLITARRNSVGYGTDHNGVLTKYLENVPRVDFSDGQGRVLKEPPAQNLCSFDDWHGSSGVRITQNTCIIAPDQETQAVECNFTEAQSETPALWLFTNQKRNRVHHVNLWLRSSGAHAGRVVRLQIGDTQFSLTLNGSWQQFKRSAVVARGYSIKLLSHPDDNASPEDATDLVFAISHVMINTGYSSSYIETERAEEKLYLQPLAYRLFKIHGPSEFTLSGINVADLEDVEII